MSKHQKSRKAQSAKISRPANTAAANLSTAASLPSPMPSKSYTGGVSYSQTFNPDYSNVIKDLKRIGTLAGIFFVVLIVLSFFLQ